MSDRLDLDRVKVRGGRVLPVAVAEIDALEDRLGCRMPAGYREYLARLGSGELEWLLRVQPPAAVEAQLQEQRDRMAAAWFWGEGTAGFGQLDALTCIPIADTTDGDSIVLAPGDPDRLFILPRHKESVIVRPADILALAAWLLDGGMGHERVRRAEFEPSPLTWPRVADDEAPAAPSVPPANLDRPPTEVLLAYFAELEAVERWGVEAAGGPGAFMQDHLEVPEAVWPELHRRADTVHRRYTSPGMARALAGGMGLSGRPAHDARWVTIDEVVELGPGRVQIRATHDETLRSTDLYTLDRSAEGWRLIAQRSWTDPAFVPPVVDAEPRDPTPADIADLGRLAGLDDDTIADLQRQYARIVTGRGVRGFLSRSLDRLRRD